MPRVFSDECFFPFRVPYPIRISFLVAVSSKISYRYYSNARARSHNYRAKYAPITQLLQWIDARFAEEKLYKCRVKYVTAIEEHL